EHECQALIALIRDIKQSGVSIIWIEHVVHALLASIDRLLVLHNGAFIADGEPQAVITRPQVAENYMGIETDAWAAARGPRPRSLLRRLPGAVRRLHRRRSRRGGRGDRRLSPASRSAACRLTRWRRAGSH